MTTSYFSTKASLKRLLRWFGIEAYRVGRFGVRVNRINAPQTFPVDFDERISRIITLVQPHTMTLPVATYNLCRATQYVIEHNIEGALVECGVWKGGSSMAIALQLLQSGITDRDIYLFDTFSGMAQPTEHDVTYANVTAREQLEKLAPAGTAIDQWNNIPLDEVQLAMGSTGYPAARIHYVKGPVEVTLQEEIPQKIAVLRLDTDWYESTKAEMNFLFPRLSRGGILLVDDYGSWKGAAKAVDEYLTHHHIALFLTRVTSGLYMGTKL